MIFSELRLVRDGAHDGPLNMAIDEVLLMGAKVPTLRLYGWSEPTVSLGYFGKIAAAEALWPGVPLVRRWTGGGFVEHGEDFTYTLIVPASDPFAQLSSNESYKMIHEVLGMALDGAPLLAAAASPEQTSECFRSPAKYDLIEGSRKVAGAAQRRSRGGLLHQGSVQTLGLERLAEGLAARPALMGISSHELQSAELLAEAKYASSAWLRRW